MRPAKPGVSSGQGPPLSSPAGRRPRPTSGYDIGDLTGRREDEAQNSNRKAGSDSNQNCENAMEHSVARARYDRPATLATGWTLAPSKGSLAEQSTRELTQVNEPEEAPLMRDCPCGVLAWPVRPASSPSRCRLVPETKKTPVPNAPRPEVGPVSYIRRLSDSR